MKAGVPPPGGDSGTCLFGTTVSAGGTGGRCCWAGARAWHHCCLPCFNQKWLRGAGKCSPDVYRDFAVTINPEASAEWHVTVYGAWKEVFTLESAGERASEGRWTVWPCTWARDCGSGCWVAICWRQEWALIISITSCGSIVSDTLMWHNSLAGKIPLCFSWDCTGWFLCLSHSTCDTLLPLVSLPVSPPECYPWKQDLCHPSSLPGLLQSLTCGVK